MLRQFSSLFRIKIPIPHHLQNLPPFGASRSLRHTSSSTSRDMSRDTFRVVDLMATSADPALEEAFPSGDMTALLIRRAAQRLPRSANGKIGKVTPEQVVEMMDEAGIDVAFLFSWRAPGQTIISNEKVAEYTTAYPERFVGIGSVNLAAPMEAAREAERCVRDYGFKGISVFPWLWNLPPNVNVYYPLLAKLTELGAAFHTLVGQVGVSRPMEPCRPFPYVDEIAVHFPDLTIIAGHIGVPWTNEMIVLAEKHRNVYIDTSGYLPKYYPKELLAFMDSRGSDKVMFGTNFPLLSFEKCVQQARELDLKPLNMEKFLWGNANRVFKLGMTDEAALHITSKSNL